MTPYFQTDLGQLFNGSALDLRQLPDESVQCCPTSPPYWGLRDYGLPPQIWDDPGGCEHEWFDFTRSGMSGGPSEKQTTSPGSWFQQQQQQCKKCSAWRGQLGLEPTPELYVSHLVQVFREVRRVLRKDGVLFCNLGDSYNAHPGQRTVHDKAGTKQQTVRGSCEAASRNTPNLKPKDLVGIPWRVAFALQADGWWLRSDIIWSKPNPMPESVTDRPTKAHEYIFLLTKSERYFFDQEAVKEAAGGWNGSRFEDGKNAIIHPNVGKRVRNGNLQRRFEQNINGQDGIGHCIPWEGNTRNIRSVWTLPTIPYPEAHFATFPQSIPERCIKAGTREGDTVLDPFFGAGTVGLVAEKLKRRWIGIELSEKYCDLSRSRIEKFLWGETEPGQERLFPMTQASLLSEPKHR